MLYCAINRAREFDILLLKPHRNPTPSRVKSWKNFLLFESRGPRMSGKAFVQLWTAILVAMVIGQVRCSLIALPVNSSGTNSHYQALDDWCVNMTGHVFRTLQQFEKIAFNKTSQMMSSGKTEAQRLAFDRRDLQIYSLLFEEARPDSKSSLSRKIQNCVTLNKSGINMLMQAMKISEMYLNGTAPFPGALSPGVVQDLRYQNIGGNMAAIKAQFRKLAEIIGKTYLAAVDVL